MDWLDEFAGLFAENSDNFFENSEQLQKNRVQSFRTCGGSVVGFLDSIDGRNSVDYQSLISGLREETRQRVQNSRRRVTRQYQTLNQQMNRDLLQVFELANQSLGIIAGGKSEQKVNWKQEGF